MKKCVRYSLLTINSNKTKNCLTLATYVNTNSKAAYRLPFREGNNPNLRVLSVDN